MRAPLPEVPPPLPRQAGKIAPRGLKVYFVWTIASLVAGLLFWPLDPEVSRIEEVIWSGVAVFVSVPLTLFRVARSELGAVW